MLGRIVPAQAVLVRKLALTRRAVVVHVPYQKNRRGNCPKLVSVPPIEFLERVLDVGVRRVVEAVGGVGVARGGWDGDGGKHEFGAD